jgi:hypothetical protein
MISTPIKILIAGLVLAAGSVGLVLLHLENRQLQRAVATHRAKREQTEQLRTDNAALRALVDAAREPDRAAREVHVQLDAARTELAALERRANERYLELSRNEARDATALAANRFPRLAMTRLEYFQPIGQATPSAAFQTAVAAAMKGDETTLANAIVMQPATRTKAEELIARLPEEARPKWTPDKLAALWVSSAFTDIPALQITGEAFEDAQHATLTFRPLGADQDEHVNLKLTRTGWKVTLPSNAMDRLARRLNATAP